MDKTALLTHCLTSYCFKFFDLHWSKKKQLWKEFWVEVKGFLNVVHNKPFSLGTFDPYVILRQFVSKMNQALTPLSLDSTLTSIIGKQPLWLSIFCSVWNLTLLLFFNFLLCLTAYHKVCMDFFRRKLIFMELTGMGQFHVIRMHKMLSLLMSPLLTQLMR